MVIVPNYRGDLTAIRTAIENLSTGSSPDCCADILARLEFMSTQLNQIAGLAIGIAGGSYNLDISGTVKTVDNALYSSNVYSIAFIVYSGTLLVDGVSYPAGSSGVFGGVFGRYIQSKTFDATAADARITVNI
jgi:hypothetical protein